MPSFALLDLYNWSHILHWKRQYLFWIKQVDWYMMRIRSIICLCIFLVETWVTSRCSRTCPECVFFSRDSCIFTSANWEDYSSIFRKPLPKNVTYSSQNHGSVEDENGALEDEFIGNPIFRRKLAVSFREGVSPPPSSPIGWRSRSPRHCVHILAGHNGFVQCLCSVGDVLFTGSQDCNIMIWDLNNLQDPRKGWGWRGHDGYEGYDFPGAFSLVDLDDVGRLFCWGWGCCTIPEVHFNGMFFVVGNGLYRTTGKPEETIEVVFKMWEVLSFLEGCDLSNRWFAWKFSRVSNFFVPLTELQETELFQYIGTLPGHRGFVKCMAVGKLGEWKKLPFLKPSWIFYFDSFQKSARMINHVLA